MIKIEKIKHEYNGHIDYTILFYTNDTVVQFARIPSGDLDIFSMSKEKEINMLVDKNEDSKLYELFDKLYTSISTSSFIKEFEQYRKDYLQDRGDLFDGNKISFQSDGPVNETNYMDDGGFIYNYLDIIKQDNNYLVKFINNYNKDHYSLNINTDRSRYRTYVYPFVTFYRDLIELEDEKIKVKVK